MFTMAGIRPHQGKTKAWNRAGIIPEDGARLGASQCWAPPLDPRSSCWRRLRRGSRKNEGCGMLSLVCQICNVATLPMRMGLGLRSATRCAEAAYCASWADALHMVGQRNPEVEDMVVRTVNQREPPREGCLAELHQAGARLDREGFWWRPTWQALHDGARPEEYVVGEPGEWQHGWQCWASSVSDSFCRKTSLLPVRPPAVPTCVFQCWNSSGPRHLA